MPTPSTHRLRVSPLARVLVLGATLVVGCGGEPALDDSSDGGSDVSLDSSADVISDVTGEGIADVPDVPVPVCDDGIDENGDGVCDREVADWSREAVLPESGDRGDIYLLGEHLGEVATRGIGHTLIWPVDVSGVLLPWVPLSRLLEPDSQDPTIAPLQEVARRGLGYGNTDELYEWVGLARHDGSTEAWPGVDWPEDLEPGDPLGAGILTLESGDEVLSFSCATCHTADLFGRTVFGMTNRSARANEFFASAASFYPSLTPQFFESVTGATASELELFLRSQGSLAAIGIKIPEVQGLDTSLAQVSLSLARRIDDEWATPSEDAARHPRPNLLADFVADSKPSVWWNLRYKTRWLSDGSIVSGNPVFTNFLWNELGRGTDLHELIDWLREHEDIVDELTVAVFAAEPPRWTDWFGTDSIDIEAAQRGQVTFDAVCSTCHGTYEKGWQREDADSLVDAELIASTRLIYHDQTPVLDVGTDPQRARGMGAFAERLNELEISRWMQTVVEVQSGYVPPPLDGIWARYPYLHNQSVPTLCDLLTPASGRSEVFWVGPSDDPETDFDMDCVGFPRGDAVPVAWLENEHSRYDTTLPGLGNDGHDEWLTDADGESVLSDVDRMDLIEFLKTL